MSAPLSRVYPHGVELARRSPLVMVVPAVIVVSLLGIAGVGFAWSSAVRTKHAVTENYNALEKRLAQTEENNAQLRGQLSVVAGRLKLTPEEEAEAQKIADRVRGMDALQIAKVDAELRTELAAKASASELDTKANNADVEVITAKSHNELAAVRKEVVDTKKDMEATANDLNKRLEREQREIELLRTAGQHTDYDFALNAKGAKTTLAGVTIELQDSAVKKNQFNMVLLIGTVRLVQKNRVLDEPIFFYRPNDTAPMELLVDHLAKHRVSGRLIVPKSSMAANSASNVSAKAASSHPSP
ncbi:MAG: hypothetical protein QOG55_3481 [Acidobacteriaceae bacterium]|jgi:hypothetical protein|nr:hypothetical protein [Acidobacteriaceae bacterium]